MSSAVVLIFYHRPDTTERVFETIRRARPERLYLVGDGPRSDSDFDAALVAQCREIVGQVDWPCVVTEIYAEKNLGLKNRVISGLDEVFSVEDSAIILEDDCLPSASFFSFCSELLLKYAESPEVGLISGNKFHTVRTSSFSYDFSHDALIWGWATWARVWHDFRDSLVQLEKGLNQEQKVVLGESFSSAAKRLMFLRETKALYRSALDSWAMYFAMFVRLKSLLVAIPEVNLVRNIGFGGVSTHTKFEAFDLDVHQIEIDFPLRHPTHIVNNSKIEKREILARVKSWIFFPMAHPVDFASRMFRYLRKTISF